MSSEHIQASIVLSLEDGHAPLYRAACGGYVDAVRYFLKTNAKIDAVDENGKTALYVAAVEGQTECLKLLIERGAIVDIFDKNGHTALYAGAVCGQVSALRLLLDHGAIFDLADEFGAVTPVYGVAMKGHGDCLKLLLDSGAKVDPVDKDGHTALYMAAATGQSECVKLLLNGGANVNIVDKSGATPLYGAAINGHGECVRLLLQGGARVDVANKNGHTAVYVAAISSHADCVKWLIESGAKLNSASFGTILSWFNVPASEILVKYAAGYRASVFSSNVYALVNAAGKTALHLVVELKRPLKEIATVFNAYPSALGMRDSTGCTPMDAAEKNDSEPPVLWFLMQQYSGNRSALKYSLIWAATRMTKRVIQSVHIHLIGHGYAGKTTCRLALAKSLVNHSGLTFSVFGDHGDVSVDRSDDSGKTKGMESEVIENKYRTWIVKDYGGQEDFHVNHARFLVHSGSVYLIVIALWNEEKKAAFSVSEVEYRFNYWLKFLNSIVEAGRVLNCITVVNFAKNVGPEHTADCLSAIKKCISSWTATTSSISFIGEPCVLSVNRVKEVRQLLTLLESSSISSDEKSFPVMNYVSAVEKALDNVLSFESKIILKSIFIDSVCNVAIKALLNCERFPSEDQHIDFVCDKMMAYLSATGKILVVPSELTRDPMVVLDLSWLSKTLLGSLINQMSGVDKNEMLLTASEINNFTENGRKYFNNCEDDLVSFLENIGACIVVRDSSNPDQELKRWFPLCSQRKFVLGCECLPMEKDVWVSYRKIVRMFMLSDPSLQMFPPGYFLDLFLKVLSLFSLSKVTRVKVFINGLDVEFQTTQDTSLQVLIVVHDDNCGFTTEVAFASRLQISSERGECWRSFNKLCELILFPTTASTGESRQSPWFDHVKLTELFVKPKENLFSFDKQGNAVINARRTTKTLADLRSLDKSVQDLYIYGCDESGMPVDENDPPKHILKAIYAKVENMEQFLLTKWNRVEVNVSSEMIEESLTAMLKSLQSTTSSELQTMICNAKTALSDEFAEMGEVMSEISKLRTDIASEMSDNSLQILNKIILMQESVEELSSEIKNIQQLNDKVLQQAILKALDESKTLHKLDNMVHTILRDRFDIPTMAIVIPVVDHSLLSSLNPSNLTSCEYSLFFVCCHTYQVVPSGPGGEGFRFRRPIDWFSKVAPVLKVCLLIAKHALMISGFAHPVLGLIKLLQSVKCGVSLFSHYLDAALKMFDKLCKTSSRMGITIGSQGIGTNSRPVNDAEAFIASIPELLNQSETEEAYRMIKDVLGNDGLSSVQLERVTSESGETGWVKKGDQAVIESFKRNEKWPMQIAALRDSYSTAAGIDDSTANSSSSPVSGSSGGGQSRLGTSSGLWLPKKLFGKV